MKKLFKDFITAVKAQLSPDSLSLSKFMVEETFINGKSFSFDGHPYQSFCTKLVEDNPGCTFVIKKSSQLGMSEWVYRLVLAKMAIVPGTSVVLSMPSITFSNEVMKTRIANVIKESPILDGLINSDNDSASVKALHNNSIIYGLSGSENSKSTLLNRPCGVIVVDEVDRQSRDVYSGYRSRQTHIAPKDRLNIYISTPTVADFGIDREYKEAGIQYEGQLICGQCGHQFLPDYYKNVVIPGYKEPLNLLSKSKLGLYDIDSSYLECPECKRDAYKGGTQIAWERFENGKWPKSHIGVSLTPWLAHEFISIPDLVRASVQFSSEVEWRNQGLAECFSSSTASLNKSDFIFDNQPVPPGVHVFGLDAGKLMTWTHAVLQADTSVRVIDTQQVKLSEIDEFLKDQHSRYKFVAGVMDQGPYNDLAYRLVKEYPRLYSCVYVSPKSPMPELFKLKKHDSHGQLVRQVSLNRTLGFDTFFGMLRDFVTFQSTPLDATVLANFLVLRKVRDYNHHGSSGNELAYKYISTSREDHFAHSYIYMMLATKLSLAGVTSNSHIPIGIKKINVENARRRLRR